jgi:hypothetical protein
VRAGLWKNGRSVYLISMPKRPFEPCISTRGSKVPAGPDLAREIKHDGYRLIVQRGGKRVRLFTRNGHDWDKPIFADCWTRPSQSVEVLCRRRRSHIARCRWCRISRASFPAARGPALCLRHPRARWRRLAVPAARHEEGESRPATGASSPMASSLPNSSKARSVQTYFGRRVSSDLRVLCPRMASAPIAPAARTGSR